MYFVLFQVGDFWRWIGVGVGNKFYFTIFCVCFEKDMNYYYVFFFCCCCFVCLDFYYYFGLCIFIVIVVCLLVFVFRSTTRGCVFFNS